MVLNIKQFNDRFMNESIQKAERRYIDLSRALGLGGELHRLVARCLDVAPCRLESTAEVTLSRPAAEALGCESLESWLFAGQGPDSRNAVFPAGFTCPEVFESLESSIRSATRETRAGMTDLAGAETRAKERLKRVREKSAPLSVRLPEAEEKLAALDARHAGEAARFHRKTCERRPSLVELEGRVAEHVQYLKNIPTPGVSGPRSGDGKSGPTAGSMARKRNRLNQLKTRLAAIRAEMALGRAGLDSQSVSVARERLELEKLEIKQRELGRYESSIRTSLENLKQNQARLLERLNRLKQAGRDLEQARQIWKMLESAMRAWPNALRGLEGQIPDPGEEWNQVRQKIETAGHQLERSRRNGRTIGQKRNELIGQVEGLLDRCLAYDAKVENFSRILDEKTADLKRAPQNPQHRFEQVASKIKALYRERSLLSNRREFLGERLAKINSVITVNDRDEARHRSNHDTLIHQAVASVRAGATQRGALIRRCGRLKNQLTEGYCGLVPLIGRSKALEDGILKTALGLVRVREKLDRFKTVLARAHDDFVSAGESTGAPRPAGGADPGRMIDRLKDLHPGGEAVARLPRQLASYRAVLIRYNQVKGLEKLRDEQDFNLARLMEKNGRLLQVLADSKERVAALAGEKSRLLAELNAVGEQAAGLSAHVEDDLYPLLKTLGLALYGSQVRTSEIREEKKAEEKKNAGYRQQITILNQDNARLEKERQEAVGSFLNLGLAVTAERTIRERDYKIQKETLTAGIEAAEQKARELNARIREIEADHRIETAAHKKQICDLNVKAAQIETGKQKAEEKARELGQALSRLEKEASDRQTRFQTQRNKLFAITKAWKFKADNLKTDLDDLKTRYVESQNLVADQENELQAQKALEAELLDLVAFFMEQVDLWAQPPQDPTTIPLPEGGEVLALLIHMLRQENENLTEAVGVLKDDRRLLALENEHLSRSHQAMKDRLTQLLPVFDFFFRSWFATTADLTARHADRMAAIEELNRIKHQARIQGARLLKLTSRLDTAESELEQARAGILRLDDEKTEALRLEAEFKFLLDEARMEIDNLTTVRSQMAKTIDRQRSRLSSLSARQETLVLENQSLGRERAGWKQKATHLHRRATALSKDLTDRKGQVESAWTTVALLGTRSREALAELQSQLTAQAETIHTLEIRLDDKSVRIDELERNQDRLGLMFWMMIQSGGHRPPVAQELIQLSQEDGFRENAGTAGIRLREITLSALRHFHDTRFQAAARKAIRRGFYSMVLACGMVVAAPQHSSKATDHTPALNHPPVPAAIGAEPLQLENAVKGPVYSPFLDRECDISFIDPWERSKGDGHIQELISGRVDDLALKTGLDRDRFVQLVQRFFDPDETVSVDRLQETSETFEMLNNHFPVISKDFNQKAPQREDVTNLVHLAGMVNILECRVWDRLYQNFRDLGAGPQKALAMLLGNARLALENRSAPTRVEFAGKLSPIPALETLGLEDFIKVVTPYFKAHIKAIVARPAYAHAHEPEKIDEYARRLACDMYVAGKTFGVPRTMLVTIAHQESYFANILGDNSLSAGPFQIYQPTKPYIIRTMAQKGLMVPAVPDHLQDHVTLATYMAAFFMSSLIERHSHHWQKGHLPLCDLDRVARSYNGGKTYPGAVYKKKIALLGYLERHRRAALKEKKNGQPG